MSVAPETVVNDPVLADRGPRLRAALADALAAEGFTVVPAGRLVALTSIDYTPWTSTNAASLWVVVRSSATASRPGNQPETEELSCVGSSNYFPSADAGRTAVFDASRSPSMTCSRSAPSSR